MRWQNANSIKRPELANPLVSIIVCGYNYGEYLTEALESVLNQTYRNIEVIVVDDGSTDNTEEILAKYKVKKIFQSHQGFATARNNGIRHSSGSFFLCLDGDDKIAKTHIEETLQVMLRNPKTAFVTTGSKIWFEETNFENIYMPHKIFFRYSVFAGWFGALGTVLIRRAAFDSLSEGFDTAIPAHEDLDLCFRLLKNWRSDLVYQPLHWYRRHKIVLDAQTIIFRRNGSIYLDKKYPYRQAYRKLYMIHKLTFGRFISFFHYPVKYLKSLQLKTRLSVQLRHCDIADNLKAREFLKQIFETLDMQLESASSKELTLYYQKKLEALKHSLQLKIA